MGTLDLGVIGNGSVCALIDPHARVVWCCVPQFDGEPAFCALLDPRPPDAGFWSIELEGCVRAEQSYKSNSAVLSTRLTDSRGGVVEILDFAPRFKRDDAVFHPVALARRIAPLAGSPRIRIRTRPLAGYGARMPAVSAGSDHVRYALDSTTLRLSGDVGVAMLARELPLVLDRPLHLVLGADEDLPCGVARYVSDALARTQDYWREWSRNLSIPFEWQDAVIRAAITLKLCQFEDTGAIVAAMTTSIPEAPHTARNWDYRFCWLRDAAYVVRALNRLGATRTMEEYVRYIFNIAAQGAELGPVYGITYERELHERTADDLAGYRGMGPVRVGNDAWRQRQNDAYGSVILASSQLFFDRRLAHPGDAQMFSRLEPLGERAIDLSALPDAGLWEFRGRAQVHTYSSVMCWAACDRLAKIAARLGLAERAVYWRTQAQRLHGLICDRAFDEKRGHFVEAFEGERLDASLLLLADIGFLKPDDPRFAATVDAVGEHLLRGEHMFRYVAPDDFGAPETSFNICTYWYIDALSSLGRTEQARSMLNNMLARRNPLGLMAEDLDPRTGEAWGNFPQTYSLVGLINAATRLSRPWDDAL